MFLYKIRSITSLSVYVLLFYFNGLYYLYDLLIVVSIGPLNIFLTIDTLRLRSRSFIKVQIHCLGRRVAVKYLKDTHLSFHNNDLIR